jgi:hypothetical protein
MAEGTAFSYGTESQVVVVVGGSSNEDVKVASPRLSLEEAKKELHAIRDVPGGGELKRDWIFVPNVNLVRAAYLAQGR